MIFADRKLYLSYPNKSTPLHLAATGVKIVQRHLNDDVGLKDNKFVKVLRMLREEKVKTSTPFESFSHVRTFTHPSISTGPYY